METITEKLLVRAPTLDDAGAVTALLNACSRAAIGVGDTREERLRNDWQVIPGFDRESDVRIATTSAGEVVACIAIWNRAEPYARSWVVLRVHPDFVNHDIGRQLLAWGEERARQKIHLASADARITMQGGAMSREKEHICYLRDAGFLFLRHTLMMKIELETPPPAPRFPEGIRIVTHEEFQDHTAVFKAVDEALRDHYGYVEEPFEEAFGEWMYLINNNVYHDPALWFLAMDGDEIIGTSLCDSGMNEDPDMGYVDTVCVRRPWRRQGIALALLRLSFAECYRRGMRKAALHVDAQSLTGATRLYEKAGMRVERQYDGYEKELRPGVDLRTQSVE